LLRAGGPGRGLRPDRASERADRAACDLQARPSKRRRAHPGDDRASARDTDGWSGSHGDDLHLARDRDLCRERRREPGLPGADGIRGDVFVPLRPAQRRDRPRGVSAQPEDVGMTSGERFAWFTRQVVRNVPAALAIIVLLLLIVVSLEPRWFTGRDPYRL